MEEKNNELNTEADKITPSSSSLTPEDWEKIRTTRKRYLTIALIVGLILACVGFFEGAKFAKYIKHKAEAPYSVVISVADDAVSAGEGGYVL